MTIAGDGPASSRPAVATRPARTSELLPLPEAPTTASSRVVADPLDEACRQALPAEEPRRIVDVEVLEAPIGRLAGRG